MPVAEQKTVRKIVREINEAVLEYNEGRAVWPPVLDRPSWESSRRVTWAKSVKGELYVRLLWDGAYWLVRRDVDEVRVDGKKIN